MSARQQARMEQASTDAIRGAFADKIPPMEPTLRDLALSAIEASNVLRAAHDDDAITGGDYYDLHDTADDARRAFRSKMAALGIDRMTLDRLVSIL